MALIEKLFELLLGALSFVHSSLVGGRYTYKAGGPAAYTRERLADGEAESQTPGG